MPNYCYYRLKVGGRYDNVDKFIQIMNNEYTDIHMYRIFETHVEETNMYGLYKTAIVNGYCAWSVASCMMGGPVSYYHDDFMRHLNIEPRRVYNFDLKRTFTDGYYTPNNFLGTTLDTLARIYSLDIVLSSCEIGMCFMEDLRITRDGTIIRNDCLDYYEFWIGGYDKYKDFLKDYNMTKKNCPISEKQFKELKANGDEYYEYFEKDVDLDEVPNEPNYLTRNIMVKPVNKEG